MGERRGTKGLELWCRKMTEGYPGVKIDNMTTSWRDGLGFCAIIHHFRPDLIDFSKLNKDDIYHNNDLAFTIAEQHLGIPALLEPEDMVEFPVPDRLSILTYLSQFYQAFAVGQGSPSRIVPKRPANASERGIVSPTSTSPPTKVALRGTGSVRREPCAKCNLPVFIAERLNVGKLLFHRTCFRCARCSNQLTLANYYETENGEFCCETCPDEEEHQPDSCVLGRSLSDEEKSASLKNDDYSTSFETALEHPGDEDLEKSYTLDSGSASKFTEARSHFIQSQLEDSASDSGNEEPPELPSTKPPDPETADKCDDSGFPSKEQFSVNSLSDNQPETASAELGKNRDFVTKEESSLVKARMRLFENNDSTAEVKLAKPVPEADLSVKQVDLVSASTEIEQVAEHSPEATPEDVIVIEDSIITISDSADDSSKLKEEEEEYPDDLNPFGEDDDVQQQPPVPVSRRSVNAAKPDYDSSLNPFGSDDEEENEVKREVTPSPKPRIKKKIRPLPEDKEFPNKICIQRESLNPFEDDEDEEEKEPSPVQTRKVLAAPRVTLTPFWKEEEEQANQKPVPLPRTFRADGTPEPKPRNSGPSSLQTNSGSETSLLNLSKRKKPAPKPPTASDGESPFSSLTSSPCHSVQHSPGATLRARKTKRAPLPPTSTPLAHKPEARDVDVEVSPVTDTAKPDSAEWENEKLAKDEENRNRQTISLAAPNKSMYGKWKRKKGPAPSRPVPQRRTIKTLPVNEIRRELEVIEIQQQGLERQGVKLEQIIREKTEAANGEMDPSVGAEVEDMILQLFELVNEKNELFRKQAELMYLRRQQRLEEEHADVEYQIRCLMLQPEANKTDSDKAREEELINRLVDIVERRNEIVECLEMDRVREAEEDDSINSHLNMYTLKRDEERPASDKSHKKEKKKHKKEKKFKVKGHKVDIDKDVDETEGAMTSTTVKEKEKKKKKFHIGVF